METRVNDNNKQVSKSLQRTWTQKLTDTNQQHYKPHSVSKVLTFNQNKNHASSPKVLFTRVLLQKKTDTVSQSKKLALNISTGWHCCNQLPLSCRHYQLALFQSHSLQTYTECTQPCIAINQMIRLKVLTTIVRTPRKWHLKALRCNSFRYLDRIFIFAATSCKQFFIPKWTSLKDASKGHKNSYQCMGLVLAGAAEGCNLDLKYPSKYYKNKPQNHNAHTTTVLQLPLLQSLWHYYNHYDTTTITMTLLQSLSHYYNHYDTATITMTLLQSLWHCYNHCDTITITMTLLQSLWHYYNHYDTTTITMTLLQSLWHCYNHYDTAIITVTLLQSLWHCYNHYDTATITMTLLQSLWHCYNHYDTATITMTLLQSLWHYYNHYDTATITMTLLQSLWHYYNHYDTAIITVTLLQSLWHCYNHYDTATITMTLLQSLWHYYNHYDTATITMTLLYNCYKFTSHITENYVTCLIL